LGLQEALPLPSARHPKISALPRFELRNPNLAENYGDHPRCWPDATALYRKRALSQQRYPQILHHVPGRDPEADACMMPSRARAACTDFEPPLLIDPPRSVNNSAWFGFTWCR